MPGGFLPTMPTLPTPTQMTNEKQQRPAHSERASGHWTLPLKLRKPLIVHSMHTGTSSFRMFFRMAGIQVHDSVGAELKPHARTFVSRNRLEPDQFYEDTAEMLEHCKAPGEVGHCRADIFASGFPCQPFQLPIIESSFGNALFFASGVPA